MGPRKKTAPDRKKTSAQSPFPPAAVDVAKDSGEPQLSGINELAAVKSECDKALTALQRGNHTKSLRLMKESCIRHENSAHAALMYRIQGTVYAKVASIIDEPNAKQRHLKNAVDSAKKAVELSPNSIAFARFYANLLYEVANHRKEYEEVVQECERALAIENPVDPAEESVQERSQQKISTAEHRILQVQSELRWLIEKSNIASISKEKKSGLNSIDPMEIGSVQIRMPDEIKKATKTLEERRKDIEVRVAAARLLQQQGKSEAASPSPLVQSEGEMNVLDSNSRTRRRRKKKNNGSTVEREDWVSSLWNSMSLDSKKDLLRIRVSDLKAHLGFPKGLACEVLLEALAFAEVNKTWKFWVCSKCTEKFADSVSHLHHVYQEHLNILTLEMEKVLPWSVGNEWIEMLLNCSWKPLDFSAAVKMSKFQDSDFLLDYHSLPTVDDTERADLLRKIQATFELLIRHNYLAESLVTIVIKFTTDELQKLVSGSQLLNHAGHKNPVSICFLGAAELIEILDFLQELSHSLGLTGYSEKTDPLDDMNSAAQNLEIKEKIVLNGDALCLILDEYLLPGSAIEDATLADANSSNGDGVLQGANGLLSWIFAGASSGDQLTSWMRMKEVKTEQGLEILQNLEKEFSYIQSHCKRKYECELRKESVQTVEDLCHEEDRKTGTATKLVHRSYESVLRERKDELAECENDVMSVSSIYELHAISTVLKEAEARYSNQVVHEDGYGGVSSQLGDLESDEDNNWKTKGYQHKEDFFIEVVIRRLKDQLLFDASIMDAQIVHYFSEMKQLELKFVPQDYQSMLLPLVKSYLRAQLEDLAEKHVTKKSDAAREALLAELACDSKKDVRVGSDNSPYTQEKSKDKKKKKKFKKPKNSKASGANKPHMLNVEGAEQISSSVVPDDVHPDSETPCVNTDDLKQKEEFRRKIEHEAETLEYERRIENEAKQKQLAEQHKSSQVFAEKALVESSCNNMEEQTRYDDGVSVESGYADMAKQVNRSKENLAEESSLDHHGSASSLEDERQDERQVVSLEMCPQYFEEVKQFLEAQMKRKADE